MINGRIDRAGPNPVMHSGTGVEGTFEEKFETIVHGQIADSSQYGGLKVQSLQQPTTRRRERDWQESEDL